MVLLVYNAIKKLTWYISKKFIALPIVSVISFIVISVWADVKMVNYFDDLFITSIDVGALFYLELLLLVLIVIADISDRIVFGLSLEQSEQIVSDYQVHYEEDQENDSDEMIQY